MINERLGRGCDILCPNKKSHPVGVNLQTRQSLEKDRFIALGGMNSFAHQHTHTHAYAHTQLHTPIRTHTHTCTYTHYLSLTLSIYGGRDIESKLARFLVEN